jgi:UDP:flavonoid glycosyltransferase YjiC (YdhE family)
MRILVTSSGSAGHLGPLLPFARAMRDQGDEVLFAARDQFTDAVARTGFGVRAFPAGDPAERDAIFGSIDGDLRSDEANRRVVTDLFAGLYAAAALPRLVELCEQWQPDVVVSESSEFAGPLAAEHAGIRHLVVGICSPTLEARFFDLARTALAPLREGLGLPAEPGSAAQYFTLAPPSLDGPEPVAHPRRFHAPVAPPAGPLPDWWPGARAPLVYLTLGSVAGSMGFFPGVYRAAIDALAPLDVRVLVTTGRDADPAALGPLPANVHAERWVDQAAVLPQAAAMVCHGGFGTVLGGLAAGVPLAVLPLFADQPYNAARVGALGAGIALGGPEDVAGAARALLTEPAYAARAWAVADEIRGLPPVREAALAIREYAHA